MQKSEAINELATALSLAQGQIVAAKKDSINPFFHSVYADLASVWEACRKPLSDNGLSIIQATENKDDRIVVETTLLHKSGQWVSSALTLKPVKDDPQGIGSAITYGRRYALSAIVGIAPDEDDDGNAASGNLISPKHPGPTPGQAANMKAVVAEADRKAADAQQQAVGGQGTAQSDKQAEVLKGQTPLADAPQMRVINAKKASLDEDKFWGTAHELKIVSLSDLTHDQAAALIGALSKVK